MRFTGKTTISALIRRLAKAEEEIIANSNTVDISQPQINEAVTDYMTSNPINLAWSSITNKPLSFPPANHSHDYANPVHTHSEYAEAAHSHNEYEPADGAIQIHIASAHAPANASPLGMAINVRALTSSPVDGQTVYFGTLPKAPTTTANISKVYIRKNCTLKIAEIPVYSGTAGTGENWSLTSGKTILRTRLLLLLGLRLMRGFSAIRI